jgi:hypothetical protein
VVEFIPGFVLEHFGKELRWRDISIEFFTFLFYRGTLVFKDHGSTSLAIFKFNIISNERLTVDQGSSEIV